MTKALPYPPPWQDTMTLAAHLSISPSTVDNWVAAGILPAPRKRGGKLLWEWAQVNDWLRDGGQNAPGERPGSITDAVRKEIEADRRARGH